MIGAYLMVPPGSATLQYGWTSPYAADADETGGVYRLTIQKQPGLLPGPLDLTIRVPEGFRITSASEGLTVVGRTATLQTTFSQDIELGLAYASTNPVGAVAGRCAPAGLYSRRHPDHPPGGTGPPVELRQQFTVMRSWFWLFVASILLAGGAAFLVSSSLPKVYESTATLIVGQSIQSANPDLNELLASQRLSQTYADLATHDAAPGAGHREEPASP